MSGQSGNRQPRAVRYPALPAQCGMVLNSLRFPGNGIDIVQLTLDWPEPLAEAAFQAAWRDAVQRHQALRTAFQLAAADGISQLVHEVCPAEIRYQDLPAPPPAGPDRWFEEWLLADRREGFDVTRPPLVRLTMIRRPRPSAGRGVPAPVCRTVLTWHHAILDGRSLRLLIEELARCYTAIRGGSTPPVQERPEFAAFARWWHAAEARGSRQAQRFWRQYLSGAALPLPLPGYLGSPAAAPQPARVHTRLPRASSERIRTAAAAAGVSCATMVNAAWAVLRASYGGTGDVVFAVTRSCRYGSIPGADAVIGLAINTVPVRVRIQPSWTLRQLLQAVHEAARRTREHQLAPLGSVLSWAGLPGDTALLDSLVVFERRLLGTGLVAGDGGPLRSRMDRFLSFPLSIMAFDEPRIELGVVHDGARFVPGSARRILSQLQDTLLDLAGPPDAVVSGLSLGRQREAGLRSRWNRTSRHYRGDATVPELFAAQVASRPQATALVCGNTRLSYAELDRRASALAAVLRSSGVTTDTPVAVAMPRGPGLITALLAVLQAGGGYLPVDLASPPPRVAAMLAAAGARIAVASPDAAAAMLDAGAEVVGMAGLPPALASGGPGVATQALPAAAHPLSLAYISFTSGSTGAPKGVAVPHRAVIRLISQPRFARLGPGQRVLHASAAAFDSSTLEIWGALLTGATLVLAPPGPIGPAEIAAVLRGSGATVAWLTAGLFHQVAETDIGALKAVPQLLAGGDVLHPDAVRAVLAARGGRRFVNGYGPTENTTFTACHVMTVPGQVGLTVPIGRPIQHTDVHILGPAGQPVPVGAPGELYTGGDGVARGYAGDPAATARAFVPDPYRHGGRLYRTGDRARWRADGTLEFLGRLDDQVKIRGFRVEPGETAAVLRRHPGVADAVVVVRGEGTGRHLAAYVTPAGGADQGHVRPGLLRDFAAQRLPEYLVPASVTVLDRLPLTASGKLDRASLPAPAPEDGALTDPPRGVTERQLAAIWADLLASAGRTGLRIGRHDSFFALGGNSLLAARLMFRIREVFAAEQALGGFYAEPTLAACAAAIEAAPGAAAIEAVPALAGSAATEPAAEGRAATEPAAPYQQPRITRRDRSRYRVDPPGAAQPAPAAAPAGAHLMPLYGDWALWRTVCLRSACLPVSHLTTLGDPRLAAAADAANAAAAEARASAAYAAEFLTALRRMSAALYQAARLPALREAVAWQNRHALVTGVDQLARQGPAPAQRASRHRQHEALVANYLQRYCAKNETIGFFGPVSWSRIVDGGQLRPALASGEPAGPGGPGRLGELGGAGRPGEQPGAGRPGEPGEPGSGTALLAARASYLEGWAVRAVMGRHAAALRPWLVPRRMPFTGLDGHRLLLPLAPHVPLSPAEAAVLAACDGARDATAVADMVLAGGWARDTAEVFAILDQLAASRRLAWQVDVAPQDIWPERRVGALLSRVSDAAVRAPAQATLAELTAARDRLAGAAGDADQVTAAMENLELTFTRLAGTAPTRRAGAAYAGRTIAYEECLRARTALLGADMLDGAREALALVLDSARWFTAVAAGRYARHFARVYRERAAALGSHEVPFADFWLLAGDVLFGTPPPLMQGAVRALGRRWAEILNISPAAARPAPWRIRLPAASLHDRVQAAFPALPRPWPTAVHHSPDLLLARPQGAGGSYRWVLGELHASLVTLRYASWLAFHPHPDQVRAALRHDLGGPAVFLAETGEENGVPARLSNAADSPGDRRLVFGHDTCGYPPGIALPVGDFVLTESAAGLRLWCRDKSFEAGLLEVLGDLLSAAVAVAFRLLPAGPHTPRVTIDDLVVSRESWTLPATEPGFAATAGEAARYRQARAWAARHGLPRHVFWRVSGERKPVYADLTSLASVDLLSRGLRRAGRNAARGGQAATVTITEMLPTPRQAWLSGEAGRHVLAEWRLVAADQNRSAHDASL
jgi:amino acid adenylation domain-containing protein